MVLIENYKYMFFMKRSILTIFFNILKILLISKFSIKCKHLHGFSHKKKKKIDKKKLLMLKEQAKMLISLK